MYGAAGSDIEWVSLLHVTPSSVPKASTHDRLATADGRSGLHVPPRAVHASVQLCALPPRIHCSPESPHTRAAPGFDGGAGGGWLGRGEYGDVLGGGSGASSGGNGGGDGGGGEGGGEGGSVGGTGGGEHQQDSFLRWSCVEPPELASMCTAVHELESLQVR